MAPIKKLCVAAWALVACSVQPTPNVVLLVDPELYMPALQASRQLEGIAEVRFSDEWSCFSATLEQSDVGWVGHHTVIRIDPSLDEDDRAKIIAERIKESLSTSVHYH